MADLHHPRSRARAMPSEVVGGHAMSAATHGAWFVLGSLTAIALVNGVLLELWREGHGLALVREYGVVESFQSLLLAIAFVLFWMAWREGTGAAKTASFALMALSAAMFVREMDVKKFHGPEWYNWIAQRGLQEILLVAMTVPILIYLARNWRQGIDLILMGLRPAALPLYIAGCFILAGAYLDARVHGWPEKMFWEELLELNGYLFLVLSACLHLKIVRSKAAATV